MLTAADLPDIAVAWGALFDASVECNLFFGPDYLIPLAATRGLAPRFRACAVWRGERLIAFAPLSKPQLPVGVARAFTHPLMVGGTPLLHREDPEGAATALLSALADFNMSAVYVVDGIRLDWPAWRALNAAALRRGARDWTLDEYMRPGVAPSGQSGPKGREKKLARNLKRRSSRLAEQSPWAIQAPVEPEARTAALRALLAIESSGWKGAGATALASRPETLAFAQAAFHPENQRPRCEYRVLQAGDKSIAACVNLVGHDHVASFKSAYDEGYGSFAPGMLLAAALADEAHAATSGVFLDSVSAPHNPLDRIWRDGVRVGLGIVSLHPASFRRVQLALRLELTRRRMCAAAKRLYHRFTSSGHYGAAASATSTSAMLFVFAAWLLTGNLAGIELDVLTGLGRGAG